VCSKKKTKCLVSSKHENVKELMKFPVPKIQLKFCIYMQATSCFMKQLFKLL